MIDAASLSERLYATIHERPGPGGPRPFSLARSPATGRERPLPKCIEGMAQTCASLPLPGGERPPASLVGTGLGLHPGLKSVPSAGKTSLPSLRAAVHGGFYRLSSTRTKFPGGETGTHIYRPQLARDTGGGIPGSCSGSPNLRKKYLRCSMISRA